MTQKRVGEGFSARGEPGPGAVGVASMASPGGAAWAERRPAVIADGEGHPGPGNALGVFGVGAVRPVADPPAIRVLVADDHPIYREGLTALIDRQPGMVVVAHASDGIEVVAAIRAHDPAARPVILTSFAIDEDIFRALRAGARGYLLKDVACEGVIDCVRAVHAGRTFIPPAIASKLADRVTAVDLTARERQVLGQVAKGKGNREIGTDLHVTEGTVKVHVNNILAKLGVASRTEAVTLAIRRGLVRLED